MVSPKEEFDPKVGFHLLLYMALGLMQHSEVTKSKRHDAGQMHFS